MQIDNATAWFLSFTSIKGLLQFRTTDLQASKVFWGLMTVLGSLATLATVWDLWMDYKENKVQNVEFLCLQYCPIVNDISCILLYVGIFHKHF